MIHDPLPVTAAVDVFKAVSTCSCGARFVEYDRTEGDACERALRVLNAHLVNKGART